jgi:predicted ribosomally synthesized peptide with SipW-like signal peptide
MKKIGLLCMALVIALGGLGIGYAAWIDTVTIDGTVTTGSVDVEIVALSGTWLWKIYPHDSEKIHGWGSGTNPILPSAGGDYDLISYAEADFDAGDTTNDTVDVTFSNICPGMFMVDFLVHYNGTVPARLCVDYSDMPAELVALMEAAGTANNGYMPYAGYEAYVWTGIDANGDPIMDGGMYWDPAAPLDLCGYQMHYCDWILVKLWIDLPQTGDDPDFPDELTQGIGDPDPLTFSIIVDAIQFNEYDTECMTP